MISCLAMVICSMLAFAQNDERIPGLYAVIGDESIPLTQISSSTSTSTVGILGVEVQKQKKVYKGVTSDTVIPQNAKFVMVCDMNKKAITQTLKKYDVFISKVNPDNLIIVPLSVEKGKNRIYDAGTKLDGINTTKLGRMDFIWEQITDNSYLIEADLEPGEYAIVFKPAALGAYEFGTVFDFTVVASEVSEEAEAAESAPETVTEEAPAE